MSSPLKRLKIGNEKNEENSIEKYKGKSKEKKKSKSKSKGKPKNKSKGKSKEKPKEKTKKISNIKLKKPPQSAYFLFCSQQDGQKKLSAKQLGDMWKNLPENEKKIYNDQYQKEKEKYDKLKNELDKKQNEGSNNKVKTKTKKDQMDKNNLKACNCGECAECKKIKSKAQKPQDEGEKDYEPKCNDSKNDPKENNKNDELKQKLKPNNENIKNSPLKKNPDIQIKNRKYKFVVGSRRLKAFGKGGKIVGGVIGAAAGAMTADRFGLLGFSPLFMGIGAIRGVKEVNRAAEICDDLGAKHVCILVDNDIFEYGDEGYFRHKNVGKTSEYNWEDNFEITGETEVSPDKLDEKIIKSNEWLKDKYDIITHNCHSFVKFCCDIIEPDPSIMSIVLINTPQCRLFRAW